MGKHLAGWQASPAAEVVSSPGARGEAGDVGRVLLIWFEGEEKKMLRASACPLLLSLSYLG